MKINSRNKQEKGITLIALVVTIVVLLILAGVSISLVLNNNGVISKAKDAKNQYAEAQTNDEKQLNEVSDWIDTEVGDIAGGSGNGGNGGGSTNLPTTETTKPYMPGDTFTVVAGTTLDNGLTIQDATENGNQYVWVEVPKTETVYPTAGLNITNFTDDEYTRIENDLHTYTSVYRNGTKRKDTWVADNNNTGWFTESEYYAQKMTMLKSVYQNGGFYVGKYETGIDASKQKQRIFNANDDEKLTIHDATQTPVIKANAYPYTWVNRTQAQVLAKNMNSGNKTSSLMFGVQWDLILAFMHTKGNVSNKEINENSVNLGNYKDNNWNITNKNAKYSLDDGTNYINCPYEKKQEENVLLTTGSSEKFAHMNIYDIAGNVWEYTLENTGETNRPCSLMGSYYQYKGTIPVSTRKYLTATNYNFYDLGFRIVIY